MSKQINPNLTEFEKSVLFNSRTEKPFTGEYDDFYEDGYYVCKNCNNRLYSSQAKFDAGCGWPAFDNCYTDSIEYIKDSDGRRTEIICNNCKVHLGHVFVGEKLTETNTRHCVNSASISFVNNS